MSVRLGILGTGHIARFICRGLRDLGWKGTIIVSPYNKTKALEFAADFDAVVANSNQGVIDHCDIAIVSVRAGQYESVLRQTDWPGSVLMVSVMAGVSLETLVGVVGNGIEIVRAMPISAAEIGKSPTLLFPDHPVARTLFSKVGTVIAMESEAEYEASTVNAAVYGWYFSLIDELISANMAAGLSADQSKEIVTGTLIAASTVAAQPHVDPGELIRSLATPGGITEHGQQLLDEGEAITTWSSAFESVLNRIRPRS